VVEVIEAVDAAGWSLALWIVLGLLALGVVVIPGELARASQRAAVVRAEAERAREQASLYRNRESLVRMGWTPPVDDDPSVPL
jgi:hypothetical protein